MSVGFSLNQKIWFQYGLKSWQKDFPITKLLTLLTLRSYQKVQKIDFNTRNKNELLLNNIIILVIKCIGSGSAILRVIPTIHFLKTARTGLHRTGIHFGPDYAWRFTHSFPPKCKAELAQSIKAFEKTLRRGDPQLWLLKSRNSH